ncbi:MAG: hypothetical protein KY394_02745, partial [Actinobacteria bacterium]|nr:hypothetical protein [Actinomycetota bacterium]
MRWLALLLIATGAASAAMLPSPSAPSPDGQPNPVPPAVAVCPVEEGSGRSSRVSVLSSMTAPVGVTVFGGGETPRSLETATGATGVLTVQATDIEAVGQVGALMETSSPSAAGVTITGTETFAGEPCFHGNPPGQAFLSGGATTEGNEFELQMMNPYSG